MVLCTNFISAAEEFTLFFLIGDNESLFSYVTKVPLARSGVLAGPIAQHHFFRECETGTCTVSLWTYGPPALDGALVRYFGLSLNLAESMISSRKLITVINPGNRVTFDPDASLTWFAPNCSGWCAMFKAQS